MSTTKPATQSKEPRTRRPIKKAVTLQKNSLLLKFWKTRFLVLLLIPAVLYYIFFKYVPMWGVSIAFMDYKPFLGYWKSEFVGFSNFELFLSSRDSWKVIRNTLILGFEGVIFSFPVPILFALLLNELRFSRFKRIVQTVTYLPHFLSTVVICGIVLTFLDPLRGAINLIIRAFGGEAIYFMTSAAWFRPVYIISGIWQGMGWGSIVYLAAISGVDPSLYEAARLDGASRARQMWHITLPAIAPTVTTMLILNLGSILDSSVEKALMLQHPITYEVSDLISTYVYRVGITGGQHSYSTAVDLFTSLVNLAMLLTANKVAKTLSENSLF